MMEIFQGSNIEEILEQMFGYIKTGIENPALPKSGFTLDSIMHLDISFHELQLTRGSSYITLPKWLASKKAVLNPRNEEDEECFKWAVIAALHHEDIQKDLQRISKLEPYSDLYNWEGLELPCDSQQIDKFEKNNKDIAVNVLYLHPKKKVKARVKSQSSGDQMGIQLASKVVNLLLITDGEKSTLYLHQELIETTIKRK